MQCEPCSCSRYGETWAEQFREINIGDDVGGEETLDLRATESITSINGRSHDDHGWTFSLQAKTTTGTSWGPVGDHQPYDYSSLRPSPRGKIKLAFISGREEFDNYCVRCQLPPIIRYNSCLRCNRTTNDHHRQSNQNHKDHHNFRLASKRKKYIYVYNRCQYQLIITTIKINLLPSRFHWIPKDNDNIETKKHHLHCD